MSVTDITPRLSQLDKDLDRLQDVLKPLLDGGSLSEVSAKMPLLDQAKLNVLICYAIESLLFSVVRLNGVDAKEHPVFTELTRVRQYFDKIKKVEEPPKPKDDDDPTVDLGYAIRFLRANLNHDKEIKEKLTEQLVKEEDKAKAKAARKEAKKEKKRQAEAEAETDGQGSDVVEKPAKKAKKDKKERKEKKQL